MVKAVQCCVGEGRYQNTYMRKYCRSSNQGRGSRQTNAKHPEKVHFYGSSNCCTTYWLSYSGSSNRHDVVMHYWSLIPYLTIRYQSRSIAALLRAGVVLIGAVSRAEKRGEHLIWNDYRQVFPFLPSDILKMTVRKHRICLPNAVSRPQRRVPILFHRSRMRKRTLRPY